jgi:toxin ParE1/3/4
MPSRRRLTVASAADIDLTSISQYAAATWGEEQADRSVQRIVDALAHLVQFPELGRTREDIEPGLRGHPVGQHIVYYSVTDDELIVRRVVHRRRDATAEFGS